MTYALFTKISNLPPESSANLHFSAGILRIRHIEYECVNDDVCQAAHEQELPSRSKHSGTWDGFELEHCTQRASSRYNLFRGTLWLEHGQCHLHYS
jgi:hypothetical protein